MKVFNYVSHWYKGAAFSEGVVTTTFSTKEKAQERMAADKAQAIEMFDFEYGEHYDEDEDNYSMVRDLHRNDYWEGEITEQDI